MARVIRSSILDFPDQESLDEYLRSEEQRKQDEQRERVEIPSPVTRRGLGDRVERIAQPIAKAIDKIAGTDIQGCGGCQKRKEFLNHHFPHK